MSVEKQIKVAYGPLRQVPFPDGVEPESMPSGCGLYIVRTTKLINRRWGVMDTAGRLVIPLESKSANALGVVGDQFIKVGTGGGLSLFTIKGDPVPGGPWTAVTDLGNRMLGLQTKAGWALADASVRPLTAFEYTRIDPCSDNRLVAQAGDHFDVFDVAGVRLATILGTNASRYKGGFCTFVRREGRPPTRVAIDADGREAFSLDCVRLDPAGEQMFLYATEPDQLGSHKEGLLDARGGVVVPAGSRQYLEPVSPDLIRFGRMETRETRKYEGTKVTTTVRSRLVWGLLDRQGSVVAPEVFADVGPEAEGLRAAILCDAEWATFGYIDDAWNLQFVVARDAHKGSTGDALKYDKIEGMLFLEPVGKLMSPFANGTAAVQIAQVTPTIAQMDIQKVDGRPSPFTHWVDHQGNTVGSAPTPDGAESGGDTNNFVPPLPPGWVPAPIIFARRSVHQLAGDVWIVTGMKGDETPVLSQFETTEGFFCGLLRVTDRSANKHGFVDRTGAVVIPPLYDQVAPFLDNRTYGKIGRQYYAISRDLMVS